ncbi:MAG: DUF362 domain-containing protein [Synergistaceae bacterium]|nr:DUF362 domain-containing protein [Synergistaceae bacterium]
MSKLLLLRRDGYKQEDMDSAVRELFEHFGGITKFIAPGDRVLLKVNLVAGHSPERCVTTHPSVARAAARSVLEAGGRPVIADSPGIDSFNRAARKAGLADAARELGVPCVELTDPVPLPPLPDAAFHKVEVSRLALKSDFILNLPKMKTHAQMLLSLGVKNFFGCVASQRKAEWHYNVGLRREAFASLLLDIWNGLNAAPQKGVRTFTILDGVVGMHGLGPTNGKPFPFGVMAGAEDALTMDFWLCRMMGAELEDFPLWRAAKARSMPQCALSEEDVAGDFPPQRQWEGVDIPRLDSLSVVPGLSRLPFGSALERALASRPAHRSERCTGCGKCAAVCRAEAITPRGKELSFDYGRCIRCYCCHEMCPSDAIWFQDGLLRKAMRLFGK